MLEELFTDLTVWHWLALGLILFGIEMMTGTFDLLIGEGFPNRTPLRARRRDDIIEIEIAKGFKNGVSTIDIVFHWIAFPEMVLT